MYSNISSINASSNWMYANAGNVANVNTKQYTPTDTVITEGAKNSPQATYRQSQSKGTQNTSGTNLTKEMTDQIAIEKNVGFNAKAIQTQDEISKTLLDIKA